MKKTFKVISSNSKQGFENLLNECFNLGCNIQPGTLILSGTDAKPIYTCLVFGNSSEELNKLFEEDSTKK